MPCGYCILCRQEQARQQAVRIVHEAQLHEHSSFITLTYADKHLPQHGSLNYDHLVKFWKRLRKKEGKLRYYAVGEYGDKSLRAHYHACVFGRAFTEGRIIIRTTPTLLWTTPALEAAWGLGNVSVGALTFQTARYTASYVTKKLRRKQKYVRVDETTGELIHLEQPRSFMSRNLGKEWWHLYGHQISDHDYVVIEGKKQKPPAAYDRWLGEVNETKLEEIKSKRKEKAESLSEEQTRARARNAHAHAESKSKSI
ncbi:MAG: replication initiator protein [Arizlama microvirus]|nr:MAG: replication initiator protein [Arizlama microvirus]